jgi:post-segregation antitoxin (ccd killing protein)
MARRNISLPDDLDEAARRAGINVSAVSRKALEAELDRKVRMARLDAWLDEMDEKYGPPSEEAMREAEAWWAARRPVLSWDDEQ